MVIRVVQAGGVFQFSAADEHTSPMPGLPDTLPTTLVSLGKWCVLV